MMPSASKKQHNLMAMVANDPAAAKRVGVPQSVGKEFVKADKGLKFGKGTSSRADLQKINRPDTRHGKSELFAKGGDMKESKAMVKKEMSFMKKKGAPASMIKHEMGEMKGMKKMASGGMPMVMKDGKKVPAFAADGEGKMKKGGYAKMANGGITTAKMGAVRTAAPSKDGIAAKGKTKGTMVKMSGSTPLGMKRGGKAC
jgi:hypothetical protein